MGNKWLGYNIAEEDPGIKSASKLYLNPQCALVANNILGGINTLLVRNQSSILLSTGVMWVFTWSSVQF